MPKLLRKLHTIRGESIPSESTPSSSQDDPAPADTDRSILIVDNSTERFLRLKSELRPLGHRILTASSVSDAVQILSTENVDLVIADFQVPERGALRLCRMLRGYYRTRLVSMFVLSEEHNVQQRALAAAAGVDDFFVYPLDYRELLARSAAIFERVSKSEAASDFEAVLLSLGQAVEARDPATGKHCHRVAMIGSSLGQSLGLRPEELVTLQRGGFLHDIGKISIPDNILFKQGPLSPEEWSVMQNHTIAGERICAGLRSLHPVLPIIRSHHERMNGTGYPDGLKGDEIPLLARVMQVADIFDALTSERPYKRPFSPESALEILRDEVKAGWRDPQVVEAFCDIFPLFKDPDSLSNCSLLALALAVGEKDAERSADLQAANQQGGVPLKAGVDLQPALVRLPDRR